MNRCGYKMAYNKFQNYGTCFFNFQCIFIPTDKYQYFYFALLLRKEVCSYEKKKRYISLGNWITKLCTNSDNFVLAALSFNCKLQQVFVFTKGVKKNKYVVYDIMMQGNFNNRTIDINLLRFIS